MAKTEKKNKKSSSEREFKLYNEIDSHYQMWKEDNEVRKTRKCGWDEITRAYWGQLPSDWPYISRITDPRIRTSVIEKDARLLNKKPKGKVIPRGDGADMVKAAVQNAVLSLQWDNADFGGSMHEKLLISSQDTRLYGSKFAYVYWREVVDEDGKVVFSGNEFKPLDLRDCGMDPKADHIRNAKWFQHRDWYFIEDLEEENKLAGKTLWKNLTKIKRKMDDDNKTVSDRQDNERISQIKNIQGLTNRIGEDRVYPVVEIVMEYREDKWVGIAPNYGEVVWESKNPFKHGKIPISQLRYYPIQDDPLGESEVAPVLTLWKAIQATVCGYLDESILKMRPPLKIIENSVRIETIEYGPEAQWLVDNPDAVTEMRSNGEAQRWFETTYAALVSAFNTAMGDLSQNVSSVEAFSSEKTATEVKQSVKQQNARDQRNQNELNDFIKDVMLMWIANNRQFLFSDEKKKHDVIKLVGVEQYEEFKRMGLSSMGIPDESMDMMRGILDNSDYQMQPGEIQRMASAAEVPEFPFIENPEETDDTKKIVKPKLSINEDRDSADLYITPQDFDGDYDFIVDVKSMEMGSSYEFVQTRQQALAMIKDPTVIQLLQQEGYVPKVRDLLVSILNEGGLNDSQRYFQKSETPPGAQQAGGVPQNQPVGGLPTTPTAPSQAGGPQPMAGTGEVRL